MNRRTLATLAAGTAAALVAPIAAHAGTSDAKLIGLCARFTELEHQKREIYATGPDSIQADRRKEAVIAPLHEEQEAILDRIVDIKAVTVEGLKARLRMIMVYEPQCIDSPQGWDDEMVGALLTDMRSVLA